MPNVINVSADNFIALVDFFAVESWEFADQFATQATTGGKDRFAMRIDKIY